MSTMYQGSILYNVVTCITVLNNILPQPSQNTPIPLSAGVENEAFFIRYKDVLCPKGLRDTHFQMLVFLKGNQKFFVY